MHFRPINAIKSAPLRFVLIPHDKESGDAPRSAPQTRGRIAHLLTLNNVCLNSFVANFFLAAALMLPAIALGGGASNAPPIDILYGAYEIIGREPGPLGPTYGGWMRIAVEQKSLLLDRCIDGIHTQGSGYITTVTADELPAVRFNYPRGDSQHEATCMYLNDFDNLPRFTCYTYQTKSPNPKQRLELDPGRSVNISSDVSVSLDDEVPGLESAFPIVWPVPISYFNCE